MRCCTMKSKQYFTFGIGIVLIIIGTILLLIWPNIFTSIVKSELELSPTSKSFNMWKETPIPMYLKLYMFNWSNFDAFNKDRQNIKPEFVEFGPYIFAEKHYRTDMNWNDNYTITFKQRRVFHFIPDLSNGTLDDEITNLNPITAAVAYTVRSRHILIRHAVDFLLRREGEQLVTTKTVREWLFAGYEDKLIDLMEELNITGLIPYDKFGWFYPRNNSVDYDGVFNMFTGVDSLNKTGVVHSWNHNTITNAYRSTCAMINGTTGELWPPIGSSQNVTMFITDFCRSVTLDYNSTYEKHGLMGSRYIGTDRLFDNGTLYPNEQCFTTGESIPSGALNVSLCRYGAPAFVSYPHFYLADPIYRNSIVGMQPNETLHQLFIALEPNTGIPLEVEAKLQINLMIENYPGISLFEGINRTFVPMLWFTEQASLTDDLADQAKLLILVPDLGSYTFIGFISIGLLIFIIAIYLTVEGYWNEHAEHQLLS